MEVQDFLAFVLPDAGYRALMVPTPKSDGEGNYKRHICSPDNAHAAQAIAQNTAKNRDVYFCLSTMRQELKRGEAFRTQANAHQTRTFFLDLDVATGADDPKASRKYATRADALQALKGFCQDVGLPRPLLVASGNYGLHCYWPFEEALDSREWTVLAQQFKALCMARNLLIDTAVPADSARVLRPIGTFNFKRNPPEAVQLLSDKLPPVHPLEFYSAIFSKETGSPDPLAGVAPEIVGSNLQTVFDGLPISIEQIGKNCAVVGTSLSERGATDAEPVWYRNMGLAGYCDTPEAAIEALASEHPGYSYDDSYARMERWRETVSGPPTCDSYLDAVYEDLDRRKACAECVHRGKITTPAQLGRHAKPAAAPTAKVVLDDGQEMITTLVNPPFPYTRSGGKVLISQRSPDGNPLPPLEISSVDFYPVQLVDHETTQERSIVWRAHLPHEGIRDVVIPQRAHYTDPGKLCGELGARGVTVLPKHAKNIQGYMVAYIRALQDDRRPVAHYNTLGWRDDAFVLPDGVVTSEGFSQFQYPPSFQAELRGIGQVKGTFDAWKNVLAFYDSPEYTAYQLAILMAIGAPLLRFTNVEGLVVSLLGERGTGKSTVLEVINSFWGHPLHLMLNGTERGATINALFRTISLHNNLPVCYDEITNMPPARAGELCYNISQGNGRKRMKDGASFGAEERWSTVLVCSTNQSFAAKLSANKAETAAEMMRLIEFRVLQSRVHKKSDADAMIRELLGNYGHAGPYIMRFVVANREVIRQKIHATIAELDDVAKVRSGERFWSAAFATALVMAAIFKRLGIASWDTDRLTTAAIEHIGVMRLDLAEFNTTPERLLVSMMEDFGPNTMVVADSVPNRSSALQNIITMPLIAPRGPLHVRREQDTQRVYIDKRAVRNYCVEHGVDMLGLQRQLQHLKVVVDVSASKALGAGTHYATGISRCWVVDLKHELIGGIAPTLTTITTMPVKEAKHG